MVSAQSVLVVEDTEEIRELVTTVLGKAGFDVRAVGTGAECMAEVRRQAPVAEPADRLLGLGRRLAELEVDEETREVRVDGAVVDLTRTEFDLLFALASRPGRVLQRETLLREVWQTDWEGNLRLVEAHMSNLRRKLQAAGLHSPEIRTVRGVGYRLVA